MNRAATRLKPRTATLWEKVLRRIDCWIYGHGWEDGNCGGYPDPKHGGPRGYRGDRWFYCPICGKRWRQRLRY